MAKCLKELYESELRRDQLNEAIDPQKVQQIQAIVDRLDAIVPNQATAFEAAIAKAKSDLGKYLGGGALQAIKNVFSDPVAKATLLANGMLQGLQQLPSIVSLYIPKEQKQSKEVLANIIPKERQEELKALLAKSFKPNLSSMGKDLVGLVQGGKLPYVDNLQVATWELMTIFTPQTLNQTATAAKSVQQPAYTDKDEQQAQTQAPQSGTTQTAQGEQTSAAAPTQQTAQTAPAKQTAATSGNVQAQGARPAEMKPADKVRKIQSLPGVSQKAFNVGELSKLSNDQIKASMKAIADALGIDLAT